MNAPTNRIAATLVMCLAGLSTADPRASEAVKAVVAEQVELARPRARAVNAAIDRTIGQAPAMPEEQVVRLARDFRVYAADRLWRQSDADAASFRLAIDTFEWASRNAVNMPAPSAEHERLADDAIELIVEQMPSVVEALYRSAPPTVRDRIAAEVSTLARSMRGMLCNRYFPELLRPASDHYTREELMAAFLEQPSLRHAEERWRPVADIQQDRSLPEGSRAIHVDFFVERESRSVSLAVLHVLRSWFVMPPEAASDYTAIPTEIMDRFAEQRRQFDEQVKREQEERQSKPDRRREIIEKSGGGAPGGRPLPPALDRP